MQKEKRKVGRPTTYTPAIAEKAEKFLATYKDIKTKKGLVVRFPSLAALAIEVGVSKDQLILWGKDNPEFQIVLEAYKAEQEKRLLDNGLEGSYNSNIAKLVLAKHGYQERLAIEGSEDGEPLRIEATFDDALHKVYGSTPKTD